MRASHVTEESGNGVASNITGPAVSLEGVSAVFGVAYDHVVALKDVTLQVERGEILVLIGPSGCGKSTILNIIAGLLPAYSGRVLAGGLPVTGINPAIGYMFQKDTLLPWATALENILLPMAAAGRRKDVARAMELMSSVGLAGFERRYPAELSGGMRKRVQLARLLAQDPSIMLLDEPFGALDSQTKLSVQEEFLRLWQKEPRTAVFVTHDLSEAIVLGDRIIRFSQRPGRVAEEFRVNLGWPRDLATLMGREDYHALYRQLWDALKQDYTGRS
jgi:NitT/TauT family transport system ATP-binding protein